MAATAITFTGAGRVQINYVLSATSYTIISDGGPMFIDNAATNITYTTISGNLVPVSSLTIDPLPYTCYYFLFTGITAPEYAITQIIVDNDTIIDINPVNFTELGKSLASAINSETQSNIKVIGMKRISSSSPSIAYKVRTIGVSSLFFKASDGGDGIFYIPGVLEPDCTLGVGFIELDTCDGPSIL